MRKIVFRLLRWVVVLGMIAAIGGLAWRWRQKHAPPAFTFKTVTLDKGRIAAKVTATGTLSAKVTVQVGTQVSGRIQEILVDFNSQVKKGDVLARIDQRLFVAEVVRNRANVMQGKGALNKSKVQSKLADIALERAKTLHDQGLLGQSDLDTAISTAESAKADIVANEGSLAQAVAQLNEAEVNLGFTTIVSPIDGMVILRAVDVGQTVAASLQAPVLFTIAQDLRQIQVDTSVAEADVGKLHDGMSASFTVDAFPGERFRGKVRQVRNSATTVQNVVTYDAVIDVDNPELKLRPGMTANVSFVWSERDDVVRSPNSALRFRPSADVAPSASAAYASVVPSASAGGGSGGSAGGGGGGGGGGHRWGGRNTVTDPNAAATRVVWIAQGAQAIPVTVHTGLTDGTLTEVTSSPLKEGDAVIVDAISTDAPVGGKSTTPLGGAPGGGGGGMRRVL
jgi:HlyD family secretion protein